jgi:serine/threonine protein kinase
MPVQPAFVGRTRADTALPQPYNGLVQPGTSLHEYEILGQLGTGGMGEVYLARDPRLNRKVAIKVLRADLFPDEQRIGRFEQEARSASALNHPNVCVIYALGDAEDGRRFIAMEHIEGQPLRLRLSSTRVTVRECLDIVIQVAAGVGAAHAVGIVHRDLKPENVLVGDTHGRRYLDA